MSACFIHQKSLSNKWWAFLIKQLPVISKPCLQRLHIHGITPEQVALISPMWKTSIFYFMKISPTLGGERQRVSTLCFIDSVTSVCMQMTQMSHNLQSHPLIFKPPDRMSSFISGIFDTPFYFVHNAATNNRGIELLLYFFSGNV